MCPFQYELACKTMKHKSKNVNEVQTKVEIKFVDIDFIAIKTTNLI